MQSSSAAPDPQLSMHFTSPKLPIVHPPQNNSKINPPSTVEKWKSVWIDFMDSHLHPAWFTPKDKVQVRIRSNSTVPSDPVLVKCVVLDYDHKPVTKQEWPIKLPGSPQERLLNISVPARYGPYLLRFTIESGEYKQEYQYVVARVQAPLAFVGDERLNGHFYSSPFSESTGCIYWCEVNTTLGCCRQCSMAQC